jgi:hypothetical protein
MTHSEGWGASCMDMICKETNVSPIGFQSNTFSTNPIEYIAKLDWIEEDWGGIISSQTCGRLNPDQSILNPLLTGKTEQALKKITQFYFKSTAPHTVFLQCP